MFLFGLLTRLRARGGLRKGLLLPVFAARRSVRYAANCACSVLCATTTTTAGCAVHIAHIKNDIKQLLYDRRMMA